ncbi:MAG TPA: DMT family transporter [Spirochaetota bacterium]|nr:DMT family transporter [Spirochaetota bacterium]
MKIIKRFKTLPPQIAGISFAVGATIIWSGNFIIARGVHDAIPPVSLSFFRWLVAFAVIAPFSIKSFISDFTVIRRSYKYIILISFLGITLFNTLVYIAGHSTEAINLSLIAITTPVFIIIFSWIFFKEKIHFLNFTGIAVTLSGIIILICRGSLKVLLSISFSAGDFWMLSAAVTFSMYSLLIRKKPEGIGTMSFLFVTFGTGLIMLIPFFIYEAAYQNPASYNINVIISILYAGIFASIGGFLLWNKSIALIGASKSGIIYYSLPLFSTLWAILILGEKVHLVHFISMILIITGIIIATKKTGKFPASKK